MTNAQSPGSPKSAGLRRLRILLAVNTTLLLATIGGVIWVLNQPIGSTTDLGMMLDGGALLKDEAAQRGLRQGQVAPGFAATSGATGLQLAALNGDSVPLSRYLGRPVWITFWATYCHACQLEEADMRRAFNAYRANGLVLLAIDVGEDADIVRRYAEAHDLPWTILLDRSGVAVSAFGTIGTPTHYFITADGMIQTRAFGRLEFGQMRDHIRRLLNS